jgi:hypothetical protein
MLCYKDKSFCGSNVEVHTCGKEISREEEKRAKELGLPIAYIKYCEEYTKNPPKEVI